jgi:ABC-type amino acid transport substrate-binding protein
VAARTRRLVLIGILLVVLAVIVTRLPPPLPPLATIFPTGEMRIGVDASNPPFAVATADDLFGLEIDLGHALGEYLGLPVRFVNLSFDGLYDALKTDQVDVLISTLTIEPLRQGEVLYTRHYFNAGLVLISPRPLTGMADLSGLRLAYEFGSQADALARRWLRRIAPFTTLPYELPAHALDAVRLGQADAALVDAISARLHWREHDWEAHRVYITDNWYPLAVPMDKPARWQVLDQAMHVLADNGTLDAILDRWL